MKPPNEREQKIYDELIGEIQKDDGRSEEEIKEKVAKRNNITTDSLSFIIIKVMAHSDEE